MERSSIKVNYLYNSAFKIETINHVLIFDYFLDSVENGNKNSSNGAIGDEDLNIDKPIYVFASHSHSDHYNDIVLSWKEARSNTKYILSSDIEIHEELKDINIMSADETLLVDDIEVKAYGSTDLGISFLVKVDDINIFHAGDLNWWNWYDESDEFNRNQEINFKAEIEKLSKENIHAAFFPVDPRLKESYDLGPDYFIEKLKPQVFIPMHFREDFYITKEFADKYKNKATKVLEITRRGDELNFSVEI